MKRKKMIATLFSFLLIFVIAGCSNSNGSGQTNVASNSSGTTANASGTSSNSSAQPGVYGEVSKISGNTVTLKLLKTPQRPAGNGQNGGNFGGNGGNGGNGNGGGNGGNGGFRGGGMRAKQYTGQVKTITIPSGVSMVEMSRGSNGMTENQVSLSDVSVGSTLSVYYKEDGKTIDNIKVMGPMTGGVQGQ